MAMRKTLTEIDAATALERETAARYEQLVNERATLIRAVDKLEPQIVTAKKAINALKQIHAVSVSADVPDTLTTRGSLFVNGGLIVKQVLLSTAANAVKDQEIRLADLEDTLSKVKGRQVVNTECMREFGE